MTSNSLAKMVDGLLDTWDVGVVNSALVEVENVSDSAEKENFLLLFYLSKIPALSQSSLSRLVALRGGSSQNFPDFLSVSEIQSFISFILEFTKVHPNFNYIISLVYTICPPAKSKELLPSVLTLKNEKCLRAFVDRSIDIPPVLIIKELQACDKEARLIGCSVFACLYTLLDELTKSSAAEDLNLLALLLSFTEPGKIPMSTMFSIAKLFVSGTVSVESNLFAAYASIIPNFVFNENEFGNTEFSTKVIKAALPRLLFNDLKYEITPQSPEFITELFKQEEQLKNTQDNDSSPTESKGFFEGVFTFFGGLRQSNARNTNTEPAPQKPSCGLVTPKKVVSVETITKEEPKPCETKEEEQPKEVKEKVEDIVEQKATEDELTYLKKVLDLNKGENFELPSDSSSDDDKFDNEFDDEFNERFDTANMFLTNSPAARKISYTDNK